MRAQYLAQHTAALQYLSQQVHLFSYNSHSGLNLLAMRSDQLIFLVLQLLIQHITVMLQLLLFCITIIQVVLSDVAVSAGCAPDRRP